VVRPDDTIEILRLLSTRRQEVVQLRIATVNRLHDDSPTSSTGTSSTSWQQGAREDKWGRLFNPARLT
jgi:hypothetical protein